MPVTIFFCYAREDEALLDELKAHLKPLQQMGLINNVWYDRDISPGTEWKSEIQKHLNTAQIVLLLVSRDFMNSDYCYSIEMTRALERHEAGNAHVLPIIVRPVYWEQAPFSKLQVLPTNTKPVNRWEDRDEAWLDVVKGILKVINELAAKNEENTASIGKNHSPETSKDEIEKKKEVEQAAASTVHLTAQPQLSPLVISPIEAQAPTSPPAVLDAPATLASSIVVNSPMPTASSVLDYQKEEELVRAQAEEMQQQELQAESILSPVQLVGNVSPFTAPLAIEKPEVIRTLTDHEFDVYGIALSVDGETLISGSRDQTIKVWELSTGKAIRTLIGHTDTIVSLALSTDGKTLISGSSGTSDHTIRVWKLPTGEVVHTLTDHTSSIYSVVLSADGETLVSGSWDKTIKVWQLSTGKVIRTLTGHTDVIYSIALSADGETLVSGSRDKTIKVWQLSTGKVIRTLTGHMGTVNSVALSTDGETLASGSSDKTIKVWKLSTGKVVHTLTGHMGTINSVALSTDGETLVSGSSDRTIKIWRLSEGNAIYTLTGHISVVNSVVLSADGKTLVSGSKDKTIKVWGVKTHKKNLEMEPLILFNGSPNHDDPDYLMWLDANPEGFVANVPHPLTPYNSFPVVMHRASCPHIRNQGSGGRLASNTQWKVCSLSQNIAEQSALRYTQLPLKYCQSNHIGGCGKFWTPEGNRR